MGRRDGSIPACAGEPRRPRTPLRFVKVYPRVCGGTASSCSITFVAHGLSPRVRGNLSPIGFLSRASGSIPACAGEPILVKLNIRLGEVYPRVCGGTHKTQRLLVLHYGLSPRVRGNPTVVVLAALTRRSIPACAGEPGWWFVGGTSLAVYPRVCGGTRATGSPGQGNAGLSPRVRGNPGRVRGSHIVGGSIPACAGEPVVSAGRDGKNMVYPRVCGGTLPSEYPPGGGLGLSPRVRGNRKAGVALYQCRRSIPACAGEPGR